MKTVPVGRNLIRFPRPLKVLSEMEDDEEEVLDLAI